MHTGPDRTADVAMRCSTGWCASAAWCCSLRSKLRSRGGSPAPCVMTKAEAHLTPRTAQPFSLALDLPATRLCAVPLVPDCRLRCHHHCRQRPPRTASLPTIPGFGLTSRHDGVAALRRQVGAAVTNAVLQRLYFSGQARRDHQHRWRRDARARYRCARSGTSSSGALSSGAAEN
jgi:hypothetical protein